MPATDRQANRPDLPVDEVLPQVVAHAIDPGVVVVEAPPGAGKTTRVPPALLDAVAGRVVVLEPRRVAARAAASRMAAETGGRLGGLVGLTTGDDRAVSGDTRIEVVTEGVLVRRLQADPALPGVGALVLDEFHERSLDADLALAFGWEARTALREDLAMVVMSATLDGDRVAALLGGAPIVRSDGRLHPVEVEHVERSRTPGDTRGFAGLLEASDVAEAVEDALDRTAGDVLVFLPGVREIRAVDRALTVASDVEVVPLHGSLPPKEQDRALRPSPAGRRTVVLATDLAESSVTVPGVRVVVDAGLAREPRLDPRTGMTRLVTTRASQASADQRAGRAGRVAPGTAIRLWSRADHERRDAHPRPAIVQADLAGFLLQVTTWGASIDELRLLDPPPVEAVAGARQLLTTLGVLDADGRVTAHGRDVAAVPAHPRLGHLAVRGRELGVGLTAARLAALLGERDLLSVDRATPDADLASRLAVVAGGRPPPGATVRRGVLRRVRRRADRLARAVGATDDDPGAAIGAGSDAVGLLAALAHPDRVGARRPGRGRFVLANGRGVTVDDRDPLASAEILVATDVDDRGSDGRVWTGAATTLDELQAHAPELLATAEEVAWDAQRDDVVARRRVHVGAATLREDPLPDPDPTALQAALVEGIRRRGLGLLPWDEKTRSLRDRAAFVAETGRTGWPPMDDAALLADLDEWLAPFLAGCRRRGDLGDVPLADALTHRIGWDNARRLDELAPTHLAIPSGRRARLTYGEEGPVLAVKLQEMFGATQSPTVAGVPVVVHLLSPAGRPLQVTTDLAGFWDGAYAQVRAEMRGRYPKHPWPEDPRSAVPTARTKRRAR